MYDPFGTLAVLESSDILGRTDNEPAGPPSTGVSMPFDEPLSLTLRETLLMEHPKGSNKARSILEIPWFQYQGGWDGDDPRSGNWKAFWKPIQASGYYEAFNKFRKANAAFRVAGRQLQDFFPKFWPHISAGGLPRFPRTRPRDAEISESNKIADDMRLVTMALIGRRLVTTVNGYLGLAPEAAEKGDVVTIMGCRFPVLLRPIGNHYKFVGECYVYGLMAGEAFQSENARLQVEDFVLR